MCVAAVVTRSNHEAASTKSAEVATKEAEVQPAAMAPSVSVPTSSSPWPRTEAGARSAAVSFLELTERGVSLTPAAASEIQRSISSATAADRLAADVKERLERIHEQVPDGLVVHIAPIAVRSIQRGERWEVAVWYTQVSVIGREIALEQWTTVTYTLVWDDGWRIDELVTAPGPVPARPATVLATPTSQLVTALVGFSDEGIGV